MALPVPVLQICVDRKNKGKTWKEIACELSTLGFFGADGKQYYPAKIASETVNSPEGSHLRKWAWSARKKSGKQVKKTSIQSQQQELLLETRKKAKRGRPVGSLSYKTKVKKLQELGFTAEQIIAALTA